LHPTEEHLKQRIADYASSSSSQTLINTWKRMLVRVPELGVTTEEHSSKVYRGIEVIDDTSAAKTAGAGQGANPPQKKKIICRKQMLD